MTRWIRHKWTLEVTEPLRDTAALTRLLLAGQGLEKAPEEARAAFFAPDLGVLSDPFAFRDMALAVELLENTRRAGGRILVYGDYDCDGLTSTALLLRAFRSLGVEAVSHIPNRLEDGYGLQMDSLPAILKEKPSLLVTVDCGSSSREAIAALMEAGIPVILTDHHQCPEPLPQPLAFLNPHRPGERCAFSDLAGVGVAFTLVRAYAALYAPQLDLTPLLCLAALGTVSDAMPMLGENHALVRLGLAAMESSAAPLGLARLIARYRREDTLDSDFLAYTIASRINAAGRMGDTTPALQLLLADDEAAADSAIEVLEEMNTARRELEQSIMQSAESALHAQSPAERRDILLLADASWHSGVIGIVAARLAEQYQLPAVVFGGSGEHLRGSARSFGDLDILAILEEGRPFTLSLGGHHQAAGIELSPEQYPDFARTVRQAAAQARGAGAEGTGLTMVPLIPALATLDPALDLETLPDSLARFAPFGKDYPEPNFVLPELRLESFRQVGDGRHLRLSLRRPGGQMLSAIAFHLGAYAPFLEVGDVVDVLGKLSWHSWNGRRELQCQVQDLQLSAAAQAEDTADWQLQERWRAGESLAELSPQEKLPGAPWRLDPALLAPLWKTLAALLSSEGLLAELPLLTRALAHRLQHPLSNFAAARFLEIFAEAGLLQLTVLPGALYRIALPAAADGPAGGARPRLSAQATWQRLEREGGIGPDE